jgi:DNA-binding NarL/FixJ family response regulator
MASTGRGALLLAGGSTSGAAGTVREAIGRWRSLGMRYEEARARLLMSRVCRALGDVDAAELEHEAALATFEDLGAPMDVAGVRAAAHPTPLTGRQCEVIRLVAAGRTNREIATSLAISEHTVARHLQNIFVKLDLGSRAAATAYAYEHGIV